MARRRRRDLLDEGIDILLRKYLGGFWAALLSAPIKKLKKALVDWLIEKWVDQVGDNDWVDGDEQDLLP